MTKLCSTEAEAIKTVEGYSNDHDGHGDHYWVFYNQSDGKIRKSINYKGPKFDLICVSFGILNLICPVP
jgi:hypothetical protein